MGNDHRTNPYKLALLTFAGICLGLSPIARADGYIYVPQSYYVAPPIVYDAYPIYSPAPIVAYQPVVVAPPPVVGYYYPLAPPVARARESGYSTPHRARYRYNFEYPNGVEYKYRYKRDGGYVRVREKWDD